MMTQVREEDETEQEDCVSVPPQDPTVLLRSNLKKIKQKIIDTSKLVELYGGVKAELDTSQRKIREQAFGFKSQRCEVDQLISERDMLTKELAEHKRDIAKLQQEVSTAKVQYQSKKVRVLKEGSEGCCIHIYGGCIVVYCTVGGRVGGC